MAETTFYIDETGNRLPDKKSDASRAGRDWFAFGGFIIANEAKDAARDAYDAFAGRWNLQHPFHITDMLGEHKKWCWLGNLTEARRAEFWTEYRSLLAGIEAVGQACVIDRPGYADRGYVEQHGNNRWLLCRTGFDIAVERATKYARMQGKKLRVVFESDPPYNDIVIGYFEDLKAKGLAFVPETSEKYQPLTQSQFADTLSTIEYKTKTSRLMQIADSYIYAIARGKYDKHFHIWRELRDHRRIINFALESDADLIRSMGIKYSCFPG